MRWRWSGQVRLISLGAIGLATVAALMRAGGVLAPPPLGAPGATWSRWLDRVGPAGAVMSGIRMLALVAVGYLTAVVALHVASLVLGGRPLAALSRATTLPPLRRLLRSIAGVGLAASVGAGPLVAYASAAPGERTDTRVMVRVDDPGADRAAPAMVRLDDGSPAGGGSNLGPSGAPARAEEPKVGSERWVIAPGDHLWSVSTRTLERAWGRPPSDTDVARYLDRLVTTNRDVLIVPDDPDLVRPGQVFVLPTIPPA